jgi:hypothetical protein
MTLHNRHTSTEHALQLPHGLRTEFAVVHQSRSSAGTTWLLYDVATGNCYFVSPTTVAGWDIPVRPDNQIRPSIIITQRGNDVIALELKTGLVYLDRAPPSGFVMSKQ